VKLPVDNDLPPRLASSLMSEGLHVPFVDGTRGEGWDMDSELSEAERWEDGSRDDAMRNSFVIPQVARILAARRPQTILDIGAGTGYVARMINELLRYQPEWVLVDANVDRLALAEAHRPLAMALEAVPGNIFDWPLGERRFEAVIITFTLLEIEDIDRLCTLLASHMDEGAVLTLAMPDAWVDVLEYSQTEPEIVQRYVVGAVAIPKRDKFTGEVYPFRAARMEDLLSRVLGAGFDLFELNHGRVGEASAFVLALRRRMRVHG
jgi:SAM-dependent methyltransferase